jgi:uncharacterized protein (UPF0333 family)
MVESAIFFPIIVLSAMFVIYMLINLYSMTALQAHTHVVVRAESAARSGTADIQLGASYTVDRFRRAAEAKGIQMDEGKRFTSTYMEAESSETYVGGRLTRSGGIRVGFYGRSYVIDETKLARLVHTLAP